MIGARCRVRDQEAVANAVVQEAIDLARYGGGTPEEIAARASATLNWPRPDPIFLEMRRVPTTPWPAPSGSRRRGTRARWKRPRRKPQGERRRPTRRTGNEKGGRLEQIQRSGYRPRRKRQRNGYLQWRKPASRRIKQGGLKEAGKGLLGGLALFSFLEGAGCSVEGRAAEECVSAAGGTTRVAFLLANWL